MLCVYLIFIMLIKYFTKYSICCIIIIESKSIIKQGDLKMNKQTALEDLFLAVRKHLLKKGRNANTANTVAIKVVTDVQNAYIDDIKKMRNVFLA